MVLVGSSKVRVCQDRTSRRGCGTKDCPCPVLSFSSSSDLIIQVFLGMGGWAFPNTSLARTNHPAAAPMASPPRAMRRRRAQGHGLCAALVAPSPRKLHLGRGVCPSLPCCVGSLALRTQRAHPPSRRHAVAHDLAPVGEEAALRCGHLPVVALERLTYRAAPHLDGHEGPVGVARLPH